MSPPLQHYKKTRASGQSGHPPTLSTGHHPDTPYIRPDQCTVSGGYAKTPKMHLNRALNAALTEGAKTVTLTHLRKTALESARAELALRNALESEAEMTEPADADERLLTLLGLRGSRKLEDQKTQQFQASPKPRQPGKRGPIRDEIGPTNEVETITVSDGEQAVG